MHRAGARAKCRVGVKVRACAGTGRWRGGGVPLGGRRAQAGRGIEVQRGEARGGVVHGADRRRLRRGARRAMGCALLFVIVAVQGPAVVACRGERRGDSGVVLSPLVAPALADVEDEEEDDRGCGEADNDEHASHRTLVPEKSGAVRYERSARQ